MAVQMAEASGRPGAVALVNVAAALGLVPEVVPRLAAKRTAVPPVVLQALAMASIRA